MMYRLNGMDPIIWLVSHTDMLPIQKLNTLPIDPMKQMAKICVSFGMTRIRLQRCFMNIGGQEILGFLVACRGFDIVPFVGNVIITNDDRETEMDLEAIWSKWDDSQEFKNFH
mgnify:FL=1